MCFIAVGTRVFFTQYIDNNRVPPSLSLCVLSRCVRCENNFVTIQSSVSKSALKEKEQEKSVQGPKKPGAQQNKNKDIDKFSLYFDFTCNIKSIQSHQVARQTNFQSHSIINGQCQYLEDRAVNG